MSRLRLLFRRLKIALVVLAGWLALHAAALAQVAGLPAAKKESATTGTGAYVMSYMLLIFAIALGMLVVCRSSSRRDRARPEAYLETSLVEQEEKKPGPKKK
jgi:heme/copper-type cytochrome/quinol oxidase subunit 2